MVDLTQFPSKPGCYIHKNKEKKIIYIGKAKNIRKRVANYFQKDHEDLKTQELVKNIATTEYIITDTEVEALILESKLIKQYKPKYNIDLKVNERYWYIKITNEDYPRVITAKKKIKDGAQYFGPFVSGYSRILTIKTINQVFKLKTCKQACKVRPGLNYHIGLCPCPEFHNIPKEEYAKKVAQARECLKGNTRNVIETLQEEMHKFAKEKRFELAKTLRDQIVSLESLQDRQKIDTQKEFDQDVIGYSVTDEKIVYFVFTIIRGTINKNEQFEVERHHEKDLQKMNQEFIMQYYSDAQIPKTIVCNEYFVKEEDEQLIPQALSKHTSYTVEYKVPKIGDTKKILDLANTNADHVITNNNQILLSLKEILKLPTIPRNIECYDISNLKDDYIVGAKVHFTDGVPNKALYRKYRIKWGKTQNDFAAMYEVLKRRLRRVQTELDPPPDLLVIDGGKGQLRSALQAMQECNLKIPMISLAKKEEEIYFPGLSKPLNTKKNKDKHPGIRILIQARDEVHRFVITYHRSLRDKIRDSE